MNEFARTRNGQDFLNHVKEIANSGKKMATQLEVQNLLKVLEMKDELRLDQRQVETIKEVIKKLLEI